MLSCVKIYAIVITYNPDICLLDKAYNSIVNQVDKMVYIDNQSINREDVIRWSVGKNIVLLCLDENEGIGTAQNIGIRLALEEGASHVVLFDQDSVIDIDFVNSLYRTEQKCLEKGLRVGVVAPVYCSYSGYNYPICTIRQQKLVKLQVETISEYVEVSHSIASGQLIRTSILGEVGLMNEGFFIEFVDYEFCFRIQKYGYKVIVTNKATMRHMMGDNQIRIGDRLVGIYSPFRRYFYFRNSILFWKLDYVPKFFSQRYLKLLFPKFLIACLYGPKRMQQFKYCIKGFRDGLKGVTGKITIK